MKHLLLFFVLAAALMVQGAPLTIVKDHRSGCSSDIYS